MSISSVAAPSRADQALTALSRLFQIAQGDTGQSGRVARFLMACWNANDLGGFDVADLFALDRGIARDIATVVAFLAEQNDAIYFDQLGFRTQIEEVIRSWGPAPKP